jgi:DNA polymerase-3 subunit delta'
LVLTRSWNDKTKQFAANITIDHVRGVHHFLENTAGKGRSRVVIIDRADELNVSAANALLKMLEEPPSFCLFLLISAQPGSLPTTIRSRCRKLRLDPLPDDLLKTAVEHVGQLSGIALPDGDDLTFLVQMAEGSVRRVLEYAEGNSLELHKEVVAFLDLLPRMDTSRAVALADRLGAKAGRQDFDTFVHLLLSQIAQRIRQGTAASPADAEGLALWAELWETMAARRYDVERLNLDRGVFILDLFTQMELLAQRAGKLAA